MRGVHNNFVIYKFDVIWSRVVAGEENNKAINDELEYHNRSAHYQTPQHTQSRETKTENCNSFSLLEIWFFTGNSSRL